MYVTRFSTENFRNLEKGEIFPCESVNVIYGGNAQGKTNLLEGLWLFTGGHSFRGAKDAELPRLDRESGINAPAASLQMDFFSEERPQKAVLSIENGRRSSVINSVKKKAGSALMGKVRAVIFSPEHLLLVKEGPSRRRSFIDGALCQLHPSFAKTLAMYNRSLLQRNALLKDISKFPDLGDILESWNVQLAEYGAAVMEERRAYVDKIGPRVQSIYDGISKGREKIEISYAPSFKQNLEEMQDGDLKELFLRELHRTYRSDARLGLTTVGPHRDDMDIILNGFSARVYGSQGQQRSAVLALKLAEAETLAGVSGETPMVLLDDVMSELDRSRQDYLLNHLHGKQVFITCCSPETVSLQETGKRFRVEAGRITPEDVL